MDDQKYWRGQQFQALAFFKEDVNHLIRLHFAREKKTLDEALCRLEKMKECFRSY